MSSKLMLFPGSVSSPRKLFSRWREGEWGKARPQPYARSHQPGPAPQLWWGAGRVGLKARRRRLHTRPSWKSSLGAMRVLLFWNGDAMKVREGRGKQKPHVPHIRNPLSVM